MKRVLFAALIGSLLIVSGQSRARQTEGRVFWKGTVDAKVQLIIKGDKLETKTLDGKEYTDGVFSFTSPLPDSPVTVGIKQTDGRGKSAVMQQPAEANNFTAIVEITDSKGGAKGYSLEIYWH